jgi:hypothetical protein
MTPELIKKVFEVTGVHPFSCDAISSTKLELSIDTSLHPHFIIKPSKPVEIMMDLMKDVLQLIPESPDQTPPSSPTLPIQPDLSHPPSTLPTHTLRDSSIESPPWQQLHHVSS